MIASEPSQVYFKSVQTLLIAEQSWTLQRAIHLALSDHPYQIHDATSTPEALEILQHHRPSIAIVGENFGGEEQTLLRQFRNNPLFKKTKVIILYSGDKPRSTRERSGEECYLKKPFRSEDLRRVLTSVASSQEEKQRTSNVDLWEDELLEIIGEKEPVKDPAVKAQFCNVPNEADNRQQPYRQKSEEWPISHDEARKICYDVAQQICWEVIPPLAEALIKEELARILKKTPQKF